MSATDSAAPSIRPTAKASTPSAVHFRDRLLAHARRMLFDALSSDEGRAQRLLGRDTAHAPETAAVA